jgi:hypothetical protein
MHDVDAHQLLDSNVYVRMLASISMSSTSTSVQSCHINQLPATKELGTFKRHRRNENLPGSTFAETQK